MAEMTVEEIKKHGEAIKAVFADGLQFGDIGACVHLAMEIVESVSGLTGAEKKATALEIINYVIDTTDLPWLPDPLVDPLLKALAPNLIEVIVNATRGKLAINALAS